MTYTHGHHESVLRSHTWRTVDNSAAYAARYFTRGSRVLDVGCGPGTITADIAARVAGDDAAGEVIGIDPSADVIAQAGGATTLTNVSFRTGDVYALEFPDASFDVVHAHQVLQHLPDPVAALREMRRVCRPDGVVAARDSDYSAFTWFPADPALDAWLALYLRLAPRIEANPRPAVTSSPGPGRPDSPPSSPARRRGASRPPRTAWWGNLWADRVTASSIAEQAVRDGFATRSDLESMAAAWRAWSTQPDGWFAVLHGEIICRP